MATMMSGGNASSPERYIDSVYLSLNEFSLQDSRGGSVWRLILIMPVSHPTGKPGVFPIYWPEHFLRIIVSASQPHQIPASQTAPGAVQPHPVQTPSCRPPLS